MDAKKFLLIDEVAELCRTSPSTVRFWIQSGRLRSLRPGRRRLIAATELQRFLEGRPRNPKDRMNNAG